MEFVEALLLAVVLALFVRTFVVQAFRIPSGSMEPTLLVGDHILVNKMVFGATRFPWESAWLPIRSPRHGDVVVFRYPRDPTQDFVKRCVATGGQDVVIHDKQLFVDGVRREEQVYASHRDPMTFPDALFLDDLYRRRDNFGPYRVPEDHCFLLGDNRDQSLDSRYWGTVSHDQVVGRALLVYWSDGEPPLEDETLGGRLGRLARLISNLPQRTRWGRCGMLVR